MVEEGSPSLVEAKKARQRLEQDAKLLANRIKLLQIEEARTRKRIEETNRKTHRITQAQERRLKEEQERERIKSERQRRTDEARKRFYSQKETRNAELMRRKEQLLLFKKEIYAEGRSDRDQAITSRREVEFHTERKNQQRYRVVKSALQSGLDRISQRREELCRESRAQYQSRIETEERKRTEKEKEVNSMEKLEMELISRLKETQMMEQQAVKQLEQVAKGRITC